MKKILVGAVVVVIALFLSGCATVTVKMENSKMLYDSAIPPTVFIVGGWMESDRPLLNPLLNGVQNSVGIVPNQMVSWTEGAKVLFSQILTEMEKRKITGPIIFVGGSAAGLHCRWIAAKHPELVLAVITIASPAGGYPPAVNKFFFGMGDMDCEVPLYIIAGYDETLSSKFWMTGEKNDGVLGLKNVLDLGSRTVTDQKVFSGVGHFGLFKDQRVIAQVNTWVELERSKARNKTPEKQSTLFVGAIGVK